ncbi:MAG: glycerophosphodiester phosphodiesterase family protein [Deltaproteobacteria bacterium]|nr:glycerophosphodiester phosphodiesterase family protein [Deltaproteobacteria bacterium]
MSFAASIYEHRRRGRGENPAWLSARPGLGLLLTLLLLASPGVGAGEPSLLAVSLVAHRGLTQAAPENSLAALAAAWQAGLAGAEVDVRTSADGVLLLLHDATLERTTTGAGAVKEKSWADLAGLRLKNGSGETGREGLPRLAEVLAWAGRHPGFRLFLDLKDCEPQAVGRLVRQSSLGQRVDLYVGGTERAAWIRVIKALDPRLRVSLDLGWWWRVEGVAAFAVQGTGVDALVAASWQFPARGLGEARQAGAEVQVYLWGNEDLPDRLRAVAAQGAQVVSCDYPLELLPLVAPPPGRGEGEE